MPKYLRGTELAEFIKNRQAKQVRALRQSYGQIPKLVIIKSSNVSRVIETYVRLKKSYASDIGVEVDVVTCDEQSIEKEITNANNDESVHAIVIQLPLGPKFDVDSLINLVAPEKDVDGLAQNSNFTSATAEAIDWLLAGNSIELSKRDIVIVGKGKLVGTPLQKIWSASGYNVHSIDSSTDNNEEKLQNATLIVSATGVPGLINNQVVQPGTVVVDAGTASEEGVIVGDAAEELYLRDDITITPKKGGVGPLTVCLMIDHVIRSAQKRAGIG